MTDKKENTNKEKNQEKGEATNKRKGTSSKKKNIFQKHPLTFLLLAALIIVFLWGMLKANRLENELTEKYETEILHLKKAANEQLGRIFALSLRSELTRNNKEQAEQYMLTLIKEKGISKVMYIDTKTNEVLFSTNKKDENKKMNDEFIINATTVKSKVADNLMTVVSPVMGLNTQLGVCVIEYDTGKNEE